MGLGGALVFIAHLAGAFLGRDDQALRGVTGAIVKIDKAAHVRCVVGIEREAVLPDPQHRIGVVANPHPQAGVFLGGHAPGLFQAFAQFLGQEIRHRPAPRGLVEKFAVKTHSVK